MEINIEAVQQLVDERFRGNVSWFAEEIEVDKTYVAALLKHKREANSNKVIVGIIAYCKRNGLNHEKYVIFLK